MSINCLIIDDEPAAIEVLTDFVVKTPSLTLINSFRDPIQALSYLNQNKIDLIFLDINMPELNGMEFVKVLTNPPLIIFTTAYSEYALESYEKDALDYLLKPITFERFLIAVNKAQRSIGNANSEETHTISPQKDQEIIYLKSGPKTHRIILNDVRYMEKDGHYITFYLSDKKILARLNMNEVFELIPDTQFIQIHKSFIVSSLHVETIERHQLKIGSIAIPIGKTYRKSVHSFFKSGL
jgi:two-component system LytT family response regulator